MNGSVWALAVSGSDLYAGGSFNTAGGVSSSRIAKWDGSSWSSLGSGVDNTVSALAVSGSDIYAGGIFTTAGGVSSRYVAKWDGSSWSSLGDAYLGYVQAVSSTAGQVFFGYLGDGVARYTTTPNAITSSYSPISATVSNAGGAIVTYIDLAGRVVAKSYSSGGWSAATIIQNSFNCFAPQVSSVPGTNQYVAFWYRNGALEYKRFNGTTWAASPSTLVPAAVTSRFASCDPLAGDSIIKCLVTSQSLSPFDLTIWSMTP